MKKLLLGLLLLPALAFSQLRENVVINSPIFKIIYNEKFQQPTQVEYVVTCFNGTASRKGLDFYKVDSVKTSDAKDYEANEWDKGHMAPAAAFSCSLETLKQTFSYLNCSLQNQYLNRGAWRLLEEHERVLSKQYGIINVRIDIEFKGTPVILATGARVPSGYVKTISIPKTKQTLKYYFPNTKPVWSNFEQYKISKP
jgi:endonuclease G